MKLKTAQWRLSCILLTNINFTAFRVQIKMLHDFLAWRSYTKIWQLFVLKPILPAVTQ